jgi:hypothetical protein
MNYSNQNLMKLVSPSVLFSSCLNSVRTTLTVAFLLVAQVGWGQLSLTDAVPTQTIAFDGTITGVSNGAYSSAGFAPTPAAGGLDSDAWAITGWSNGDLAFAGTQNTGSTDYRRGQASAAVTSGGMYHATMTPHSSGNPALLFQPGGGDFAPGTITLKIQNNGSGTLTSLTVSYNLYVRNDQGRSTSFNFSHSADNSTYTTVAALDYTTIAAADALGWVQVSTSPSRSTTITGISIASGAFYYIRWSSADVAGSGSRDEIGLDDITVASSTNYYWNGNNGTNNTANNTWNNNTTQNWGATASSTFAANAGVVWPASGSYNANFNNAVAGAQAVTIPAAISVMPGSTVIGVTGYSFIPTATQTFSSPITLTQSLTVSPATGTSFTMSGIVSSTGGLTVAGTGTGTVISTGAHTYSGTTTVSSGELRMNPGANISLSGACTLNGGTLSTTGITASRTVTFASINLSDNTTLALASATAHTVTFTALGTLTSAKTLTITGWTGASYATGTTTGTNGKVFIGSSASLSAAQLSQIRFYNGTNYYAARQLSSGEIVPTSTLVISTVGTQTQLATFSVTVTARDLDGNAVNLTNATGIALTSNGNAGTIGGTTTGTIGAGTSAVTISGVSFPSAGTGVTITATRSSGDQPLAGTSATFVVDAAACSAPTITAAAADNLGATVARLNGAATAYGAGATAISERGFEYATNSGLTTPSNSNETGSYGLVSYLRNLTGLNANTQYWFRAYGINDCGSPLTGYSHTSSFPTFTTQHNAPTIGAETSVTSGGFTGNWTVNNANSAGGAAFTYQLEYSTTSDFSSGVTAITGISSGASSQAVTGLSAATNYWYRVRVNNAGGNSNYSSIEAVTTLNSITTGAVSTSPFCVSATGTASGTVAFTSVGTFTGNTYSVELSNSSGTFGGTMIGSSVSNANSGTISVTIPANTPTGAGYRMRVLASSPAITGVQSSAFTINLGPANATALSTTAGNAQVSVAWTNPATCFDDIMIVAKPTASAFTGAVPSGTSYTHSSNSFTDGSNTVFDGGIVVYRGGSSSPIITNLTNGTSYTFKIFSRKNNDWSSGVTTTGTPVAPAVNLTINTITGTEAAATPITLTATAASAVVGDQTVTVTLSGAGLTAGDFTGIDFSTTQTITILNGATTGTRTFAIADDNLAESSETATFTISTPTSGVTIGLTDQRSLTITNNPLTYIILTALNVPATENFDGMGTSTTATTPTGFGIQDANTTTVDGATTQGASTGTPTAGGSYNWGQNGTSDRALGFMFNGSGYDSKSVVAAIKNSTGSTGTIFEISFDYEQYRRNSATQTFKLQYSTSLTTGWVDVTGGNFSSIVSGSSTYNFTTLIASQSIATLQYTPASTIPDGNVVYFRWSLSGTSSSNGVGIDNFSVALITISCPTPTTQATNITFNSVTENSMNVAWTNGDGSSRLVYANTSNSFSSLPADGGTIGTPNTVWANSGEQLIYNGSGSSTSISGLSPATTYYFRVFEYNCTAGNTKFLNTTATNNPNSQATTVAASTASVIVTQGGEAATISSLLNGTPVTTSNGAQVWRFRLHDGNGSSNDADALPTIYTGWTITASADNTVPDWSTAIEHRRFFLASDNSVISGGGIINASNTPFPLSTNITVPDNGYVDVYMRITLKNPLPLGSDGQLFGFQIANGGVTVESDVLLSSQLGSFTTASDDAENIIDIDATLQFISAPNTVGLNDAFTITVSAIDANGNVDINETSAITLAQNTGTGNLVGESTANLVAGTYTWTGLTYDVEETFQVLASGGGFANITANINVIDADYQSFDHFNRSDSYSVGVPSSEVSATYSESGTGDGSRQRIQGNQLILSNCNFDRSDSGNGFEQVVFNMDSKYETMFSNAGETMNWKFNMRSTRSSPSGFPVGTYNTYAAAVILGCDESDYSLSTADGYAVIIGNQSSPDPVKLVRFSGGIGALGSNANVTDVAVASIGEQLHLSVNVSFNPCTNLWSLWVRNDSGTFVEPNTGSFGSPVTATNTSLTSLDLKYAGFAFQHGASCADSVLIDNFYIPISGSASTTDRTWNGSVSTDWHDGDNWDPCPGVPTITNNVIIPAGMPNNPHIYTGATGNCRTLTIGTTSTDLLYIDGTGTLNIATP